MGAEVLRISNKITASICLTDTTKMTKPYSNLQNIECVCKTVNMFFTFYSLISTSILQICNRILKAGLECVISQWLPINMTTDHSQVEPRYATNYYKIQCKLYLMHSTNRIIHEIKSIQQVP